MTCWQGSVHYDAVKECQPVPDARRDGRRQLFLHATDRFFHADEKLAETMQGRMSCARLSGVRSLPRRSSAKRKRHLCSAQGVDIARLAAVCVSETLS